VPASAATTASFTNGVLTVFGDGADNSIVISRDAAGRILLDVGGDALGRLDDGRWPTPGSSSAGEPGPELHQAM
jgi:hypothetical protein